MKPTEEETEGTNITLEDNIISATNNMSLSEKKELEDSKLNLDSNSGTERETRVHLDTFGT